MSDEAQQVSATKARGWGFALAPFRLLSWIAGGLSLANLLRDLQWVSLTGIIGQWVDAYQRLVTQAAEFVFGWIKVSWVHLSTAEAHGLVLALLFISTYWRATYVEFADKEHSRRTVILVALIVPVVVAVSFIPVAVLALVLPGSWGFWTPVSLVTALFILFFWFNDDPPVYGRAAATYLVGVTGIAMIAVLVGTLWR